MFQELKSQSIGAQFLAAALLCLSGFTSAADSAGPSQQGVAPGGTVETASIEATDASQSFGLRLANAALAQRWVPAVYNPAYVKIPYPGGDVPWYTGVCTDVVVRAYRALGIDLQVAVHKSRVGSGDTNIDHRRVTVLRKFFRAKASSLSTAEDPALYKPGDIVTMHVPDGQSSKTHIVDRDPVQVSRGRPAGRS